MAEGQIWCISRYIAAVMFDIWERMEMGKWECGSSRVKSFNSIHKSYMKLAILKRSDLISVPNCSDDAPKNGCGPLRLNIFESYGFAQLYIVQAQPKSRCTFASDVKKMGDAKVLVRQSLIILIVVDLVNVRLDPQSTPLTMAKTTIVHGANTCKYI